MKLLIAVSNYPNAGHPYAGAFNERSAQALCRLGHEVEVLAPRPYVPRGCGWLSLRWRSYEKIRTHESHGEIAAYRPPYWQLPLVGGAVWNDRFAYLASAPEITRRHRRAPYDAILGFNLIGAGGLAWRLGRRLKIPAVGWATGNDVRCAPNSSYAGAVRRALTRLELVFYQSAELRGCAAALLGVAPAALTAPRHVVLARGVEAAPAVMAQARPRLRRALGATRDRLVVLYLGRIVAAKGVFELAQAMTLARQQAPELVCWMVGVKPGFDDSPELAKCLNQLGDGAAVQLVDACAPAQIWDYFAAANIFAFPSHSEGMPNSLLEAMAAGLPALAYGIAPIEEIDNGGGVLVKVTPHDVTALAQALVRLARAPAWRAQLAQRGRARVHESFLATQRMGEAVERMAPLVDAAKISQLGRSRTSKVARESRPEWNQYSP